MQEVASAHRRLPVLLLPCIVLSAVTLVAQEAPAGGTALTPFARAKAVALLRDRLPCLGCHRLDGTGGEIGPDLSAVAARRSPEYIAAMVRDPQSTAPGAVMPRVPMPDAWRDLVVRYLAERREGQSDDPAASAPSPESARTAAPPRPAQGAPAPPSAPDGAALYARYCAACHGATGGGDGPNARHLPTRPTVHADSAYMSTRPDDTLYDGIAAGGYILGRSHFMPPFGETLTRAEIRALVRHLRSLCRCEGPAWSRDGRP